MILHFIIAVAGIAGGVELLDGYGYDDDGVAGLVIVIVYGVAALGSLVAMIAGTAAACSKTASGAKCATIGILVGSIITFLVQVGLIILDGVEGVERVYWTNVWTILAFLTSGAAVGLSVPALQQA